MAARPARRGGEGAARSWGAGCPSRATGVSSPVPRAPGPRRWPRLRPVEGARRVQGMGGPSPTVGLEPPVARPLFLAAPSPSPRGHFPNWTVLWGVIVGVRSRRPPPKPGGLPSPTLRPHGAGLCATPTPSCGLANSCVAGCWFPFFFQLAFQDDFYGPCNCFPPV